MRRSRITLFSLVLLASFGVRGRSQDAQTPKNITPLQEPAVVSSVRVLTEHGLSAIEVVSTHQVVPTIQSLDSPPRIVVDLANARVGSIQKRTPVLQGDMLTLRTEQFQIDPPITRVVLDLLVPYGFTWDIAGNRLMVRLKPPAAPKVAVKKPSAQAPKEMSLSPAAAAAVVPVTGGVGEVVLAGRRFAAGSSLTAGSETAVLQLKRGGEVRVCPGTTLSITTSNNAKDLMLGLSTGGFETHYSLNASADSVLTPDFRILFAGPGEFDFAVSADSRGNTCVRGLKDNTSSAIVSELIGDRIYQVKPTEQAVFHSGRIDKVDADIPAECGCPPVPVLLTDATKIVPDSKMPEKATLGSETTPSRNTFSAGPETQPLPRSQPNDVHVQVDAPLVFNARDRAAAPPSAAEVAALPVIDSTARPAPMQIQVQPPRTHKARPGVFHRLKEIFGALLG